MLTPVRRIDIEYAPRPHNRLARLFARWTASFTCAPEGDGVNVTRTISIEVPAPARWILDRYLEQRLQPSVERELELAAARLQS